MPIDIDILFFYILNYLDYFFTVHHQCIIRIIKSDATTGQFTERLHFIQCFHHTTFYFHIRTSHHSADKLRERNCRTVLVVCNKSAINKITTGIATRLILLKVNGKSISYWCRGCKYRCCSENSEECGCIHGYHDSQPYERSKCDKIAADIKQRESANRTE